MAKSLIDPEGRFADLITPIIEDMGFRLVRVITTNTPLEGQIVQIMVDGDEQNTLNLDECAKMNRSISAVFEVEDPISGAYRLEVGSPGIDRPLTRLEDFETYKDMDAKVELEDPIETGQKRFKGILKGCNKDRITLETDQGDVIFGFNDIRKASLVMNESLLKQPQKKKILN